MKTLETGWDLDGILYPFEADLMEYMIQYRGWNKDDFTVPWQSWSHWQEWGITLDEFLEICHEATNNRFMFLNADPYPGSVEAVQAVKAMGHRVHIITSRSFGDCSAASTEEWLIRHEIPYDSLLITSDKHLIRPDIMVDDYEKNLWAMQEVGVPTYLLDRTWNQHVDTKFRIHSLDEYVGMIAGEATK